MLAQLFKDKSQTIDFILMAIAAVIFIGGWLATQLRKMREQSGAARKPGERPPAALPQRLDDLAAKHPQRVKKMVALYDAWAARSEVLPWRSWIKKKPKK